LKVESRKLKVLAIETSTPVGGVAVGDGTRLLAEVTLGLAVRHSEALLPGIRFALEQSRIEISDIGAIVVGAGPGSFTGVRIAAATAKGLVRALGVPLFAYSSLLALAAAGAADERPVCALLDARRGEVYAACYRFGGRAVAEIILSPMVGAIDDVVREVQSLGPLFIGDGALQYRDRIASAGRIAPAHVGVPRPSALLWFAAADADGGRVAEPARWQPEYLRPSGAERGVRG
jgi:tRNA threonylcarbamoyladenosine biosynthesis protein TsaB